LRHGGPEPWDTATQHLALYTCINATNTKTTHHCGDGVANLLPHKTARSPPAKRASGTCVNTVRAHQRAELSCLHRIALACTSIVHRRLSLSSRAISPPILGTFMFEVTRKRRLVRNQLDIVAARISDSGSGVDQPRLQASNICASKLERIVASMIQMQEKKTLSRVSTSADPNS
ncbi:hypothetical protein IAQ61_000452, partial [Plenodomus lingam]